MSRSLHNINYPIIKKKKSIKKIVVYNMFKSLKYNFVSNFLFQRYSTNPNKNNKIVPDNI